MGLEQSTARTLYAQRGDGSFEEVPAETLRREYLKESELSEKHKMLLVREIIIPCKLFYSADASSGSVLYYKSRGPLNELAVAAMRLHWNTEVFTGLIPIVSSVVKDDSTAVVLTNDIISAVAKNGYEMFPTEGEAPAVAPAREDIARIIDGVPGISAVDSVKSAIVDFMYKSVVEAQSKVRARVGGSRGRRVGRGLVFAGGVYERVSGMGVSGGAVGDVLKTLDLDRLSGKKGELADALVRIFESSEYSSFKGLTGTREEKLREISKFLRGSAVKNGDGMTDKFTRAINTAFGMTVIDPTKPTDMRINEMEELLQALSHGVTTDFYLVGADLYKFAVNISRISSALKVVIKVLMERRARDDVPMQDRQAIDALKELSGEMDRYVSMMMLTMNRNFKPTLAGIVADEMGFDSRTGRTSAERIGSILNGIVSTATQSLTIAAALKELGMTMEEFAAIKDKQEFWMKFVELTDPKKLGDDANYSRILEAAEIAAASLGNAGKYAEALKSGGAPLSLDVSTKSMIQKKIDAQQLRSRIVVNSYGLAIQGGLRKIREAITNFAGAVGKEIPLGGLLDNFVDLLRRIPELKMERNKIHLALLGYYRDAQSTEIRDRILGTLRSIAEYAGTVAKDPAYSSAHSYFDAIAKSIADLIAAIDHASDSVREISGRGEDRDGGAPLPDIRSTVIRDTHLVEDAIKDIEHRVSVEQIKSNLTRMSAEFEKDTRTYETQVLGPAVAARIDILTKARADVLKSLGEKGEAAKADEFSIFGDVGAGAEGCDLLGKDAGDARGVKKFIENYYESVIGFWDIAQAIELYLKNFTGAIMSSGAEIDDVAMMIREVEIISDTYNRESASIIAAIFEENFHVGADFTGARASVLKKEGMYPEWSGLGGLPFTPIIKDRLSRIIVDAKSGAQKFIALKNLLAFFIHFGSSMNSADMKRISRRSPIEIYKGLTDYMAVSAFAFGFKTAPAALTWDKMSGSVTSDAAYVVATGAGDKFGMGVDGQLARSVIMRPAEQGIAAYDEKTGLDLAIENQVFVAIIKALASKILVLAGLHDLINRPHERSAPYASIRMILGGSVDDIPKIDDAATELYVRLPLLALFYKTRLQYDREDKKESKYVGDTNARIALLPDITGSVFSDFIHVIFRRFSRADPQFLTDNEMKVLIAEINRIYASFSGKFPKDTVRCIMNEFVQTMSRMVYIVTEKENIAYRRSLSDREGFRTDELHEQKESYDIDILGDEGAFEDIIKQTMPADELLAVNPLSRDAPTPDRLMVRPEHGVLIRQFRCMLERELSQPTTLSLRGSIVATQTKLGQTTNGVDRFKLVSSLVRGTGGSTTIENMRKMIFLEIMGTGLGMLSGIYSTLKQFQIAVYCASPKLIAEALVAFAGGVVGGADDDATIKGIAENLSKFIFGGESVDVDLVEKTLKLVVGRSMESATAVSAEHAVSVDAAKKINTSFGLVPYDADGAVDLIAKTCVNYHAAFQLLIEAVTTITGVSNDFVRADITDGRMLIDFGLMEEFLRKFISTLVTFVDVMRPHIDPEIIDRFTLKRTPGSLYWFQEQIIEKLIENRITDDDAAKMRYVTLTEMSRIAQDAYSSLVSPLDKEGKFIVNYAPVLARMVAFDASAEGQKAIKGDELFRRASIMSNGFDSVLIRGTAKEKTIDTRFLCSLAMSADPRVYSDVNNSIMFAFNKMLAMFLRQTYDAATGKIPSVLIDTFAQGAFNSAIMSERNTYPDHKPCYWVSSGQPRSLYAQAAIPSEAGGAGSGALAMYAAKLREWLGGDDADTDKVFAFTSAGIEKFESTATSAKYITLPGGMSLHRFIAGMMLAWFANESDCIDEVARTVRGVAGITEERFAGLLPEAKLTVADRVRMVTGCDPAAIADAYMKFAKAFEGFNGDIGDAMRNVIINGTIPSKAVLEAFDTKLFANQMSAIDRIRTIVRGALPFGGAVQATNGREIVRRFVCAISQLICKRPELTLDQYSQLGKYGGLVAVALVPGNLDAPIIATDNARARACASIINAFDVGIARVKPNIETMVRVADGTDIMNGIGAKFISGDLIDATAPTFSAMLAAARSAISANVDKFRSLEPSMWMSYHAPAIATSQPLIFSSSVDDGGLNAKMADDLSVDAKSMVMNELTHRTARATLAAFTANMMSGIYRARIAAQINDIVKSRGPSWLSLLKHTPGTPSQIMARARTLNALMLSHQGPKVNVSANFDAKFDGVAVDLYAMLMTAEASPASRANGYLRAYAAVHVAGASKPAFIRELDSVGGTDAAVDAAIAGPAKPTIDAMRANALYSSRAISKFAEIMMMVFDANPAAAKDALAAQFKIPRDVCDALVERARDSKGGFSALYANDAAVTARILGPLLNGGLIFDDDRYDAINEAVYKFVTRTATGVWQTTTTAHDANITDPIASAVAGFVVPPGSARIHYAGGDATVDAKLDFTGGAPALAASDKWWIENVQEVIRAIRAVHDLVLQLGMIASVDAILGTRMPMSAEPVDAYAAHMMLMLATPGFSASLTNVENLRDRVFDGFVPSREGHFRGDARAPGLILAQIIESPAQPGRNTAEVLTVRDSFSMQASGMPAFIGRLEGGFAGAWEAFVQMFPSFGAGVGTPARPVYAITGVQELGSGAVRHIINLTEFQQAEFSDSGALGVGTYIMYPGAMNERDPMFRMVSNHHLRTHGLGESPLAPSAYMRPTEFGERAIPDGEHVLFASLGHIFNNLLTSTDERTGIRAHLLESAADIPAYLRDKYRAVLPMMRAMFHTLSQKCDFIKRLVEQGRQKNPKCFDALAVEGKKYDAIGYKFQTTDVVDNVLGILRGVSNGASAVVQDCSHTLKAIGDQPRYFEVSSDSISAYRSQNGADPIMPISPLLRVMLANDMIPEESLQPKWGFGESAFKYQYAIRGLYHQMKVDGKTGAALDPLQTLAGLESMVGLFNKYSHGSIKIEAGLAQDLARLITSAFDFVHDVKLVKFYTSPAIGAMRASVFTTHARADMKNTAALVLTREKAGAKDVPVPFGISKSGASDVSNVIAVVENHNREDAIRAVVTAIMQDEARGDAIIANLVDMNIIPLDIHVLLRQMPLGLLWNYAFTFDTIVGHMLYPYAKSATGVIDKYFKDCAKESVAIKTAIDAMFVMLTDPYKTLTHDEKIWVDRMLIGAVAVPGMGRLKFLSDQLAGGILMGSLINDHNIAKEIGPQDSKAMPGAADFVTGPRMEYVTELGEYGEEPKHATSKADVALAPVIHDMRMDTLLVRNFIHIGLVFAVLQNRLRSSVVELRNRQVADAMSALDPKITQFTGFATIAQTSVKDERTTKKYI